MRTNRRKFLGTVGTGAAALTLTKTQDAAASVTSKAQTRAAKTLRSDPDAPILQIGDNIAVAHTSYGKVPGFILRDVPQFLGIPYGAATPEATAPAAETQPAPAAEPATAPVAAAEAEAPAAAEPSAATAS